MAFLQYPNLMETFNRVYGYNGALSVFNDLVKDSKEYGFEIVDNKNIAHAFPWDKTVEGEDYWACIWHTYPMETYPPVELEVEF